MPDSDDEERSIWSSKYGQEKPNSIERRMRRAPPVPAVPRTRTQAVLTALPVLMLLLGLSFYWSEQRSQRSGSPILSEQIRYAGQFDRITPSGDKTSGNHYLWLTEGENTRSVRLSYEQKALLRQASLVKGTSLELIAAPTVSGSTVLWLVEIHAGTVNLLQDG